MFEQNLLGFLISKAFDVEVKNLGTPFTRSFVLTCKGQRKGGEGEGEGVR